MLVETVRKKSWDKKLTGSKPLKEHIYYVTFRVGDPNLSLSLSHHLTLTPSKRLIVGAGPGNHSPNSKKNSSIPLFPNLTIVSSLFSLSSTHYSSSLLGTSKPTSSSNMVPNQELTPSHVTAMILSLVKY